MTVFDASIKLYAWFSEHDSFCVDVDEKKLFSGEKRSKFKRTEELAAIGCALNQLETMELISSSSVEDKKVWILRKNFNSSPQSIQLAPETCLSISQIVNGFCDAFNMETEKSNPSEIGEQDIKNLAFICAHLMDDNSTSDKDTQIED